MKKIIFLSITLYFFTNSFAAFEIKPSLKKADEIFLPINKNIQISLINLSFISIKDFENLTGKHLNFIERIGFKAGQKKLRKSINPDSTINNKQLFKLTNTKDNHSIGFNVGWFFIGWFLSILGVVLAYALEADEPIKKNRIKWAWIGFGIATLSSLLLILIIIKV